MDLVSILREINNNGSNFKRWETDQENIKAKREQLAKKNPPAKKELREAAARGEVILNAADRIDQYAEDIAESIETRNMFWMFFVPLVSFFASGFLSAVGIIMPADKEKYAKTKQFFDKNKTKINNLVEKILNENPKKIKRLSTDDILNKNSLKNLEISAKLKSEAEVLAEELSKINGKFNKKAGLGAITTVVGTVAAFVGANIYDAKSQIQGARIARHKVYRKMNYTNLIVLTPEQRKKLKQNRKNSKISQDSRFGEDELPTGMIKGLRAIKAAKGPYKAWKASDASKPKKVEGPFTPEERIESEKDQEVIQRLVKDINTGAEIYAQNMEVVGNVLIGGTPVLGWLVGRGIAAILNATKVTSNLVKKMVNTYGDEKAKKAYEELAKVADNAPGRRKIFLKFKNAMKNSNIEKEAEKGIKKTPFDKALKWSRQCLAVMLSHKGGRNKLFGVISFFLTGITGTLIGLKLQKVASRVGRYVAKKEKRQHKEEMIGRTKQELRSVPNKYRQIEKPNKIKEKILFIPTVLGQYFDWKRNRKTEAEQPNLTEKDLKELGVTKKQINDAKNLERKVKITYETVDDKTEVYQEKIDTAGETLQPFVFIGGILLMISPVIIYVVQYLRGKVTAKSITNKIISILSGSTNIMKTKFFKNYLNDVAKRIPDAVRNQKTDEAALKALLKDVDLKELIKNRKNLTAMDIQKIVNKKVKTLSGKELKAASEKLDETPFLKEPFEPILEFKNMSKIQRRLKLMGDKALLTILSVLFKDVRKGVRVMKKQKISSMLGDINVSKELEKFSEKIGKMSEQEVRNEINGNMIFKSLQSMQFDLSSIDKAYLQKTLPKLQKIVKNVPKEDLENVLCAAADEFSKNPDQFVEFVRSGSLPSILITKKLQTAMKIAGISWAALNFLMMYVVESWLADMQLKAGRLGVMKALDELKDPAYYANIDYSKESKDKEQDNKKLRPAA